MNQEGAGSGVCSLYGMQCPNRPVARSTSNEERVQTDDASDTKQLVGILDDRPPLVDSYAKQTRFASRGPFF